MLVFVNTFSGWVEAYPTRTERSSEVVRAILREIIPHFGLPGSIQSNNGPVLISEITQNVSKFLGIKWKLYMAWRPHVSGEVEKMNHTLKKNVVKLCQETHLHWDQVLPIVLPKIRVAPQNEIQRNPYEIVYGNSFQAMIGVGDVYVDQEVKVKNYVHLSQTLAVISDLACMRDLSPTG